MVTLQEVFAFIWLKKNSFFSIIAIFAILITLFSFILPNRYISNATLFPAESMTGTNSNFSNLSSFPFLGPDQGSSKTVKKALERMGTYSFFINSIEPNIDLKNLHAVKNWNSDTGDIIYDSSIYDVNKKLWTSKKFKNTGKPSSQQSFRAFKEIFSISQDKISGFITIELDHMSPFIARDWLNLIIEKINFEIKNEEKELARLTVNYLENQISITSFSEVRENLAQLLKEQINKLSLIEAKDSYVFEVIEPPIASELKSGPNRPLLIIFGVVSVVILNFLVYLLIYLRTNRHKF